MQRQRTFASDASRSNADDSVDADPINAAFNAVVAAAGPDSGPAPLLDLSVDTPKAEASPLVDVGDAEAAAAAAGLRVRNLPASMVGMALANRKHKHEVSCLTSAILSRSYALHWREWRC